MKKFETTESGEKLVGFYEMVGTEMWVHINGKSFIYEDESKQRRKKTNLNTNTNEIVAPMPGKITNIKLLAKDKVTKGDVVIIMEAMKMEYSLKAPKDTEIQEVKCKVGDQVLLNQVLVTFKDS